MLGIIGAMKEEVQQLKDAMEQARVQSVAGMDFYKGNIGGKEVVAVQSGVGKVNAAVCAQILVDLFQVTAIVNTGIAGSLRPEINIGDIVLSTDAVQHDVDAAAFGYDPGQIPQMKTFSFPADERLIRLAAECCGRVNPEVGVHKGRVTTGDQFISGQAKKDWIAKTFDGACAEMEGGAIAQTAYLNQIPFLIVRAISDKADDSAHMDYPEFEQLAIRHSVNLTKAMIEVCEL